MAELVTDFQFSTVFLDRDGVINRRPGDGYVTQWSDFHFLDGVKTAVALLRSAGARVIVVTNQRCVAHGLVAEPELAQIHHHMIREMEAAGGAVDAVYHCPHHPDQCDCKKPKPGMLLQARRDFPDIDFHQSVIIGDSLRDLQAGHAVGCQTILVGPAAERSPIVDELARLSIPLLAEEDSLIAAVRRDVLPRVATANRQAG